MAKHPLHTQLLCRLIDAESQVGQNIITNEQPRVGGIVHSHLCQVKEKVRSLGHEHCRADTKERTQFSRHRGADLSFAGQNR